MKWKHAVVAVKSKGKVRFTCSCGGGSEWLTDEHKIEMWPVIHTGLVEKEGNKR